MIDANTHELNAYLRKQDRADELSAMWEVATKHLYEQLEQIGNEYRALAMHFEDEHNVQFDWNEDVNNAIGI